MNKFSPKNLVLPIAVICVGFVAIISLDGYLDRIRPGIPAGYEDSDLAFNGSRLKGFALGFEGLMADWYWMRSLQYIGGKIAASKTALNIDDLRYLNPRLLYPYLDNATDLDPHFIGLYSYGAIVLPAIDAEQAIAIAKKGIDNNKETWQLYQHLGFIYWKLERYKEAADAYRIGSEIPGSAGFMKMMAAKMEHNGGSRDTARIIYRDMLSGSEEKAVKDVAELKLKALDSLDDREAIDKVLADFKEKTGRCAGNFGEITRMLMNVNLPENRQFSVDPANRLVDPTGAPYLLDKDMCRSRLDVENTKLPPE